jgi:hypothetical protein
MRFWRRRGTVWLALLASFALAQSVDDAPGVGLPPGLQPPTSPVFADAAWYDLVSVRWVEAAEPTLEIELGALDPVGPGPYGMRQPIVEVYLDDGTAGAVDLLPGSGLRMPAGAGWREALRLTGDGAWYWRVEADGEGLAPPRPLEVEAVGRTLRVTWPTPVPAEVRLYAISGVYDPFSADGWRAFAEAPSPWAFSAETPGPPIVDLLPGDADAWQQVRSTGALLRIDRPGSRASGSLAWVWWLLMTTGMALAVVGVAWRTRRGAPAAADAGPVDGTKPGTAGADGARVVIAGADGAEGLIVDADVVGVDAEPAAEPGGAERDQFSGEVGAVPRASTDPSGVDVVPASDGSASAGPAPTMVDEGEGTSTRTTDEESERSRSANRS